MASSSGYLQYSFVLPAALTVLGWFIVARQADRRDYRKEVREHIGDLHEVAGVVRVGATEYWLNSTPKTAAGAAVSLKAEVKRLSRQVTALTAAGLHFEGATLMGEVRKAATGGDFEKAGRKHSPDDVERVTDLIGALEDLLLAVDAAFYAKFKPMTRLRLWRYVPLLGTFALTRG